MYLSTKESDVGSRGCCGRGSRGGRSVMPHLLEVGFLVREGDAGGVN